MVFSVRDDEVPETVGLQRDDADAQRDNVDSRRDKVLPQSETVIPDVTHVNLGDMDDDKVGQGGSEEGEDLEEYENEDFSPESSCTGSSSKSTQNAKYEGC